MTSKFIIDINAQVNLRFWHRQLNGYNNLHGPRDIPLPTGATVRAHIELGKLYFMGTGGNFNYEAAIKHIKTALIAECSSHCLSITYPWRNEAEKYYCTSLMYSNESELQSAINSWNEEAINRIEILKNARFDSLLNRLRAELQADELKLNNPESQALTQLFDTLWQASFDFATKKNPDLVTAKQEFGATTIAAIGNIHKTLVTDNLTTLLTQILSAIVSICTLGIANYATDRSMYGLFSSRIDTAVKLNNLLTQLGHPEDNTSNEAKSLQTSYCKTL